MINTLMDALRRLHTWVPQLLLSEAKNLKVNLHKRVHKCGILFVIRIGSSNLCDPA